MRKIDWGNHAVELLLVIAGILVALGIDNWNTERQQHEREFRMLGQLHQDLSRDLVALQDIVDRRESVVAAIDSVLAMTAKGEINEDALSESLAKIFTLERFSFRRGAYEVIKSSSIALQDDQLRLNLSDYYEYSSHLSVRSIEDIEYSFHNSWLPLLSNHVRDWTYGEFFYAENPQSLLSDKHFTRTLKTERDNNDGISRRINPLLAEITSLLEQIEASRGNSSRSP